MAPSGKLEIVLELKSSPQQFYNVWKNEAHQVPKHSPKNIQAVKVHEGDWQTSGSIKIWSYTTPDGKAEWFKEKIELDDATRTVSLHGLEGHVFDTCKVFRPVWKIAPNPKGTGSLVTCIIEFEKLNDSAPPPYMYLDFMVDLAQEVDAGLTKGGK